MIQYNALPLSFLADNNVPKDNGFAGKHLAGVLHALLNTLGQQKVVDLWNASRLNIELFVAKELVQDFVTANVRFKYVQYTEYSEWPNTEKCQIPN